VEFHSEGNSLSEVISLNPMWWTATAKVKAVAGIVLSLRFAHAFGLIHGHLSSEHIAFHVDHRFQITNSCFNRLADEESEKGADVFSGERWSPDPDVRGFTSILFEIIVGHPPMLSGIVNDEEILRTDIPVFVSELMASAQ
jgi:hypothetical protein